MVVVPTSFAQQYLDAHSRSRISILHSIQVLTWRTHIRLHIYRYKRQQKALARLTFGANSVRTSKTNLGAVGESSSCMNAIGQPALQICSDPVIALSFSWYVPLALPYWNTRLWFMNAQKMIDVLRPKFTTTIAHLSFGQRTLSPSGKKGYPGKL